MNQAARLYWTVPNAYSLSSQQCYAFVEGSNSATAGSWSGIQGGSLSGSDLIGSASITATAAGTYVYALTCSGVATGSATLVVLPSPTVTVTPSSQSITLGQSINVQVTVAGTPTPTGSVMLTSGNYRSALTGLFEGAATIIVTTPSDLSVGTYTLTATYDPDANSSSRYAVSSGTAQVTVSKAVPTVTVMPASSNITTADSLMVQVKVTGTPTPTGGVTLTSGGYKSAATPLNGGAAQITISAGSLAAGSDTLTATYLGDPLFAPATGTASVNVSAPSFTLSPSPASVSVPQGGTGNTTITVTSVGGFSGTVALSASTLPSGVTGTFAAGSIAGTQVLTLTATASASVTSSPVTVTVTGTSGSVTATTSFSLSITPQPAFTAGSGGTTTMSLAPGATTGNTGTVSVAGTNGFSGTVNLTCAVNTSITGVEDKPTCSLNPTSVVISGSASQTSTLTVNTTAASSGQNDIRKLIWPAHGTALALLVLLWVPRRRCASLAIAGAALLFAFLGLAGCGGGGGNGGGGSGGGSGSGNPGTTAGTYTITVTGTSGSVNATVATITLTVQ